MTKQEKIKEAYGEHWNAVKNDIDESGWMNLSFAVRANIGEIGSKTYQFKDIVGNPNKCRILSLIDLENNNGWVKIESESDLPEQGGEYIVFRMSKKSTATYCKNDRWMVPENAYPKTTFQHGISHYRKKEIIPNPIY